MSREIFNATVTASQNGSPVVLERNIDRDINPSEGFRAAIIASAVGGTTPNFAVDIEDSPDGINWFVRASFVPITANGSQSIAVAAPFHPMIRVANTVTGTAPTADLQVIIG